MRIALILPGFSAHAHDWAIPALQHLVTKLAQQHDVHIFSLRYPPKGIYHFQDLRQHLTPALSYVGEGAKSPPDVGGIKGGRPRNGVSPHFNGLTHHAIGGQGYGLKSVAIIGQTVQAIYRQHQQTPFDLLHAFWADEPALCAMFAQKLLKRSVMVNLGGWELSHLPHIAYGAQRIFSRRLMIRYVLHHAHIIAAGSAYQLNLARQHGVSPHKLHFAPLGVDTNHFMPPLQKLSLTQPALIQIASLIPVKNHTLLLQTLHLVKAVIPHIHLHLVGTGPLEKELKSLAQQLGITENITWHAQVPHLELPALYHQAHLYVQSSWHESQGMAVLEAMACGLPVIGTPVGLMPEVACLPPTFIATQLAAQIIAIFSNPHFYQTATQQARQIVADKFSLPATTNTFETLYQSGV